MSTTPTLQVFYGISSPWAYFGAQRAQAIAQRHGARLVLRPIRIIEANGGIPLRTRLQPRQDYHALELSRWREFLNIPLNLRPRFYPCRTIEIAAKAVIALQQAGLDAPAFSFAVQQALWAQDRDIADVPTLQSIALAHGGAAAAALVQESSPADIEAQWQANLADAEALGVFGTPTYVVDGELFWGQDRLDFVDRKLSSLT
ncbi:MAG: 2-hydroxychromene-2-carboxylate isomerase [Comamonas sp.]